MQRSRWRERLVWLAGGLVGWVGLASPSDAEACGGFACSLQQPVVQTGERILFIPDPQAGTIDVVIDIAYEGPSESFVWLLPLSGVPLETWVGSSSVFDTFDAATQPRLLVNPRPGNGCRGGIQLGLGASDEAYSEFEQGRPLDSFEPTVEVRSRKEVGPYESVVLEATTANGVGRWLEDNGYDVPPGTLGLVAPYLAKGNALLALKLRKSSTVGEIQPIHLRLPSTEACVPLRLTAIAAVEDMDVFVTVVSTEGRAIPTNWYEVEPNWVKLDWQAARNYGALIRDAVDEASGLAFVTEYAEPTSLRGFGDIDLAALGGETQIDAVLARLGDAGLSREPGVGAILRAFASDPLARQMDELGGAFLECPLCFGGKLSGTLDPGYIDALRERIAEPLARAEAWFYYWPWVTRLHTVISPEEMSVDPVFAYRDDLDRVSNILQADQVFHCSFGGGRDGRSTMVVEQGGRSFSFSPDDPELASLPSAFRARQLAEGTQLFDNASAIERKLEGCRCAAPSSGHAGLGLLLGCLIALRRRWS